MHGITAVTDFLIYNLTIIGIMLTILVIIAGVFSAFELLYSLVNPIVWVAMIAISLTFTTTVALS